ncbi:MAG: response regulator [bacterium]|nr:response regulator [bacterium]
MVYIIEDDKNVRDGFMMLLESAGIKCNTFESAESFLQEFEYAKNDLLILDMNLRGKSGCTLLEELTSRNIYVPVIVITAFDLPQNRKCAKDFGAIAYLRKPVDSCALIDLIKYNLEIQIPNKNNNLFHNQRSTL